MANTMGLPGEGGGRQENNSKLELAYCELICELHVPDGSFRKHVASVLVKSPILLKWEDYVGKVLLFYLLTVSKQKQKLEEVGF